MTASTARDDTRLEEWLGPGEVADLSQADLADLEVAVEAALAGGREVMRRYRGRQPMEVEEKAPDDPVTEADREADRAIVRALQRLRPGEPVRSEEAGLSAAGFGPDEWAPDEGHLWVVDPLDGTKEFLARNGEFSVMVGLAVAGGARLGAVYRPDPGVLFLGSAAGGAWRAELKDEEARGGPDEEDDEGGDETVPGVRGLADFRDPLPLSVEAERIGPVRIVHSRSHRPDGMETLASALGETQLLPSGSAGLKCALVASDEADLYVHPVPYLKEWDTCAPEAVLRGAGGRVTDCRGEPLRYGKEEPAQPHGLFAARPGVWEAAAGTVRELAP